MYLFSAHIYMYNIVLYSHTGCYYISNTTTAWWPTSNENPSISWYIV